MYPEELTRIAERPDEHGRRHPDVEHPGDQLLRRRGHVGVEQEDERVVVQLVQPVGQARALHLGERLRVQRVELGPLGRCAVVEVAT